MTYKETFIQYQKDINTALENSIKSSDCLQKSVFEAMRYSLNAGGKRIRPVLVLEFARVFGVSKETAMPFAVALEMIHTYSLIHDDLPCMDDDDMRRGRPTNHKVFGEATAVLAGDALLNRAFEHITNNCEKTSPEITLKALKCLAEASGASGMIGGQIIDMEGENRALSVSEIKTLQSLKTGAIIRAGALIGCILGNADGESVEYAKRYADNIGLAFQIKDDILNIEGDAEKLGKDIGNDEKSGKSTFVKLLGMAECKKMLKTLTDEAVSAVKNLPESEFLVELSYDLTKREN